MSTPPITSWTDDADASPRLQPLTLARAEALVFRAAIDEPVATSFGIMHDRPAVFVRVEDTDGRTGWGEIWCNFPAVGAEHRARMFDACVAPILLERTWPHPRHAFHALTRRLHVLALQSGEPGTVAQIVAAADVALWDLAAKASGEPLWRLLGGKREVGVYASGLSPMQPQELAERKYHEGFRAFKLKVGFDGARDVANLRALRERFGPETPLMIDANQAWGLDAARAAIERFAPFRPAWLEEPLPADAPLQAWESLSAGADMPLAAGENIRGTEAFEQMLRSPAFAVIQPDIGKWGGFTGILPVARSVLAEGRLFCPHWLGGGIGLMASLHVKAAAGGPGYVEVDANPNPLRERIGPGLAVKEGKVMLNDLPGLGLEPDLAAIEEFRRPHRYQDRA